MRIPNLVTTKLRGEWAEVYFMQQAMARGLAVAKPYGDSCKYDFIVESRGKFSRVQVRAAFRPGSSGYKLRTDHGGQRPYLPGEIDFIAGLTVLQHAWYIVPIAEIAGRRSIYLYPWEEKTISPGRFEKFREAWELLEGETPQVRWSFCLGNDLTK
jgi:hypothetical protein